MPASEAQDPAGASVRVTVRVVPVAVLVPLFLVGVGCALPPGPSRSGALDPVALPADVATTWFDLQMRLIQSTPGFTPPVAARALGYAGVALYEAVVPAMAGYRSLAGQLSELPSLPQREPGATYDEEAVANAALATVTRYLYDNLAEVDRLAVEALEDRFAGQVQARVPPEVYERSLKQGRAVGTAVFRWSTTDGGYGGQMTNFPTTYQPPAGPGLWTRTPRKLNAAGVVPPSQPALQPWWGSNRPFLSAPPGGACAPPPPPDYSESPGSAMYRDGREVYDAARNLTGEQRAIALFWSDGPGTLTPPGHSVSTATQILRVRSASLETAAVTYAKAGIAVADSFIACWQTKYRYNLLRPLTYIRKVIDPAWDMPLVTDPVETPPFPEYTSGHSVQSAAVAEVLTDLFGEVAYTDHTHDARGLAPRSFASFRAAAEEAAISRLYGGIHFRSAIENGLAQGTCIGNRVNALDLK